MKNWRPFVFYHNKQSNCSLSLVAASHKLYIHVSFPFIDDKNQPRKAREFVLLSQNIIFRSLCIQLYTLQFKREMAEEVFRKELPELVELQNYQNY